MQRVSWVALVALLAGACTATSTRPTGHDGGATGDAPRLQTDASQGQPDGPPRDTATPTGDGGTGGCLATADYAAVGAVPGQAEYSDPTDPTAGLGWFGPLNQATPPDYVAVQLYGGFGVFPTTITTGTFQLTGNELNFATCGVCVLVWADISSQGQPAQEYLATGGSVTLTSVTGRITGTLTNVTFEHVTINPSTYESTPLGDGCESKIGSLSFDSPITTPDGGV
jgi:hypothetical protein